MNKPEAPKFSRWHLATEDGGRVVAVTRPAWNASPYQGEIGGHREDATGVHWALVRVAASATTVTREESTTVRQETFVLLDPDLQSTALPLALTLEQHESLPDGHEQFYSPKYETTTEDVQWDIPETIELPIQAHWVGTELSAGWTWKPNALEVALWGPQWSSLYQGVLTVTGIDKIIKAAGFEFYERDYSEAASSGRPMLATRRLSYDPPIFTTKVTKEGRRNVTYRSSAWRAIRTSINVQTSFPAKDAHAALGLAKAYLDGLDADLVVAGGVRQCGECHGRGFKPLKSTDEESVL